MRPRSDNPDRLIYQFAFAAATSWLVLAFLNWNNLVQGAQFGLPGALSYRHPLLFGEAHVQWRPILAAVFLNFGAALLGYVLVIRPIWGRQSLARPVWLLFAGIPPGYLLVVAYSRVVTLFLPSSIAPHLILSTMLLAMAASLYVVGRRPRNGVIFRANDLKSWFLGAFVFLAVLIFEVQFDIFHVAGEAINFFIEHMFLSTEIGIGTKGYWPLALQHYDEAAFLYSIVYGLVAPGDDAKGTLVVLYWITIAAGRLGGMTLTYLAVRGLGVDRLSSFVVVGFFTFASLSLNPISTRLLFDSLNPLGYTLHAARFWIAVLPVILISAAVVGRGRATWSAIVLAVALGIGLSATPAHVALVIAWAVATLAATALLPAASDDARLWRAGCIAGLIVLAACTLSYGLSFAPAALRAATLLCGAIAAGLIVLGTLLRMRRSMPLPSWTDLLEQAKVLVALCGGYVAGVLLMGNVLAGKTLLALSSVWPWSHLGEFRRLGSDITFPRPGLSLSPYCVDGVPWMERFVTGHCGSLPAFVRAYGLPIVAITFVFGWWLWRVRRSDTLKPHHSTMVFWGIVLSLVALPVAFVLFDFLAGSLDVIGDWKKQWLSIWLRSRLIEPWFYSGTLLAIALFLVHSSRGERQVLQSVLMVAVAIYILGPLVLPAQLVANLAYLLARAFGV